MARKSKMETAIAVRDVKKNLKSMVALGWLSPKEYKSKMRIIGERMRRGD
jgi:hypothetical protein